MNALLDQQAGADAGVLQVKVGDRVSGVLVRLGEENCFVDFGGRSEGMIRTTEMKGEDGELAFKVGEPLEAFVVSDADSVVLSRFVSGEARQADTLYKAYKAGIPIEGKVMAVNKWGIGVDLEGMRAFCPVSQVDTQFTKDLEQYRDKKMTFKIIRFRDHGRSIVLSRRALLEAEQEKDAVEIREKIVDGTQLTGTVTRLENFGAFVDVGSGVEGLIHVSEMRHERVNHPKDVVQPGEEVTVKVIAVKNLGDRRKERISLSIKALEKDPWDEVRSQFPAGTVTMGKIEGVEEYGAFVELAPNVRGLIHVSELAERRVNHPRDVVSVGEEVKVAVMEVDNKRKRLRLSIRRAEQVEGATNLKEFAERQRQEKESEGSANTAMLDALKRAKLVE
ncbi:MAG TPA: S1 RNA-binding domain-containing protein [Candidatus Latescibacteria bacterium]|jgi:small subunit ribosomal protein S1|nr:S1 RNA-binding domain-containing protein [Candidatus Latescibacterota bacterium]